ncbi:phytanoyl-CoA dioxygenase family protein [Pseudomonas sp. AA-38]|uniref:phytanoyl-CoA dioxygenase family protein n=1 Tax=Pseudomonas sp. AA-38 TaxID=3028807 RepID=UPI0023F67B5C|nr:phytanoyl-CoA dioxygenase family protein [Pseudomonas sp. AA-38]
MLERERLHRDGYTLLRQAIAPEWLDGLRDAFDAGVKPADQWPVPRGTDYRHSLLDDDPSVQAVCRLPQVLAVVGALIGERFFLAQVEGREPLAGRGHQRLHRDLSAQRPGDIANALAYFDDYGPDNGATRLVPGSHRPLPGAPEVDFDDESAVIQLAGRAGDILLFDVDLLHAGSLNPSGARRRSILISYFSANLYESHLQSMALRGVRMDTRERFTPEDMTWPWDDR